MASIPLEARLAVLKEDKIRKIIYVILAISCCLHQPILGAQLQERPWNSSSVARFALALSNDPSAQREFLERVAASQSAPTRTNDGCFLREEEEKEDTTGYALTPVPVAEQIRLTASDIIANNAKVLNFQKVFYVDLSDLDFSV